VNPEKGRSDSCTADQLKGSVRIANGGASDPWPVRPDQRWEFHNACAGGGGKPPRFN